MLRPSRNLISIFTVVGFGIIGGLIGGFITNPPAVLAQGYQQLIGKKLEIQNNFGKVTADIFTPENGGGILDLYAEDGTLRLQAGTYSQGGEKGLPLLAMSDNSGKLRLLVRLAGANESPVIIMKDKSGRDRIVMGLDLSGIEQEPFLATISSSGKKKMIFGSY